MATATLYRSKIKETEWTLSLDSGIDWPNGWNQESFYAIAETLLRQA